MWEKCGVQNQKIGVWAWCLIIPFVVLKTAKFGVKILGGWRMSKTNQPVPTYGKVNAQEEPNCSHHYLLQCSIATT